MSRFDVTFFGAAEGKYLSQWLAGLAELDACGFIRLGFTEALDFRSATLQAGAWAWLLIEPSKAGTGDSRLVFLDLMDSSTVLDQVALERCDVYLKRGYVAKDLEPLSGRLGNKIKPMPLQYPVASEKQNLLFRTRRAFGTAAWRTRPVDSMRNLLLSLLRGAPWADRLGVRKPPPTLAELCSSPEAPVEKRIYLRTRLYEPKANVGDEVIQRVAALNAARINIILALREAFGDLAYCGLYETVTNARLAPKLIKPLPREFSTADGHRLFSRQSLINVNTVGVSGSNGWKIAEILAAGSCLVTETLRQEALDKPTAGVHAEVFDDPDACIAACQRLLNDPDYAAKMRIAGAEFFHQFLSPEASTRRLLEEATN